MFEILVLLRSSLARLAPERDLVLEPLQYTEAFELTSSRPVRLFTCQRAFTSNDRCDFRRVRRGHHPGFPCRHPVRGGGMLPSRGRLSTALRENSATHTFAVNCHSVATSATGSLR